MNLPHVLLLLLPLLMQTPGSTPEGNPGAEGTGRRLERICAYLESGTPNQRAAALRQLSDDIHVEHIGELRAFFNRPLGSTTLLYLRRHYDEIVHKLMDEAVTHLFACEVARRRLQGELEDQMLVKGNSPPAPEQREEWMDLRRTRDDARAQSYRLFRVLFEQGIGAAPTLWSFRASLDGYSYAVGRFQTRLGEELVKTARQQFAHAPVKGSLSAFERRALVPLIDSLLADDPAGWERFREEIAGEGLALFESFDPLERKEARELFLELGEWGIARLERWQREEKSPLPDSIRIAIVECNRLHVPPGLLDNMSLPLARYSSLSVAEKKALIVRLTWTAGAEAIPVFQRLLDLEPNQILKVGAALALTRLNDPAGAAYLKLLFYQGMEAKETTSRQLLLASAVNRREAGDPLGALQDLELLASRFPRDFDIEFELAMTALHVQSYEVAIAHFRGAIALDPASSLAHYNLACACALSGKTAEAIEELSRAIDNGFKDADHMESDDDLKALQQTPEFLELLKLLRALPDGR